MRNYHQDFLISFKKVQEVGSGWTEKSLSSSRI